VNERREGKHALKEKALSARGNARDIIARATIVLEKEKKIVDSIFEIFYTKKGI
jgi:hypothetical protein